VSVRIRLKRAGSKKRPFYRVVVTDSRRARDSRSIEDLGYYNPLENPVVVNIDRDRVAYWTGKGALCSDTVGTLLKEENRTQPSRRRTVEFTAPAPEPPKPKKKKGGGEDKADQPAKDAKPAKDVKPAKDAKPAKPAKDSKPAEAAAQVAADAEKAPAEADGGTPAEDKKAPDSQADTQEIPVTEVEAIDAEASAEKTPDDSKTGDAK